MCQLTTCKKCNKLSFNGCGKHLAILFKKYKISDLCKCNLEILKYIDTLKTKK